VIVAFETPSRSCGIINVELQLRVDLAGSIVVGVEAPSRS